MSTEVLDPSQGKPRLLFHYTSLEGLLSILGSRTLWASDAKFLNDARELETGRGELHSTLMEAAEKMDGMKGVIEENDYLASLIRRAASHLDPLEVEQKGEVPAAFVTCFCEVGDLLSQWRGYGQSGGFAIGFRTEDMLENFRSMDSSGIESQAWREHPLEDPRLVRVGYGAAAIQEMVSSVANIRPDTTVGPAGNVEFDTAKRAILPALASVKDPAFAEEREWRMIALGASSSGGFRAGPFGAIVPYVHLTFPVSSVSEIVIGPGAHDDLRKVGVERILHRHGYDIEAIVVRLSQVPYRE